VHALSVSVAGITDHLFLFTLDSPEKLTQLLTHLLYNTPSLDDLASRKS